MDRKGKGQPITSWTIHMIFRDFLGKRAGLIKALTTGPSFPLHYEKFRQQCDPQKPYMCLYGCPDETWELKEPPDVPHELPEPNIGINFARDGMPEKEWLAHIAIHSDAWLYSYAFYIAIRAGLDAETSHLPSPCPYDHSRWLQRSLNGRSLLPSRLPLLFPSSNSRAPSLAFSSSAVVAVAAADYLNLSDDELMAA
ncbi:unnamed protein product [Musa hybrid cultivar]